MKNILQISSTQNKKSLSIISLNQTALNRTQLKQLKGGETDGVIVEEVINTHSD